MCSNRRLARTGALVDKRDADEIAVRVGDDERSPKRIIVRFFDYADALCRPLGVERVDDRLLQRLPRNRGRNYATMTTMFPNFCPVSAYR